LFRNNYKERVIIGILPRIWRMLRWKRIISSSKRFSKRIFRLRALRAMMMRRRAATKTTMRVERTQLWGIWTELKTSLKRKIVMTTTKTTTTTMMTTMTATTAMTVTTARKRSRR